MFFGNTISGRLLMNCVSLQENQNLMSFNEKLKSILYFYYLIHALNIQLVNWHGLSIFVCKMIDK